VKLIGVLLIVFGLARAGRSVDSATRSAKKVLDIGPAAV